MVGIQVRDVPMQVRGTLAMAASVHGQSMRQQQRRQDPARTAFPGWLTGLPATPP